jgi:hypothetical protein
MSAFPDGYSERGRQLAIYRIVKLVKQVVSRYNRSIQTKGDLLMSNQTQEQRIKQIEQNLTAFQARYIAHVRYDHFRLIELEFKIRDLENRIQDLAYLERAVLAVHEKTHAHPPEPLEAVDSGLEEAIHRICLSARSGPPRPGLQS